MTIPFGAIADDYTGASDLGAMLARAGLRVGLTFGVPDPSIDGSLDGLIDGGADAVIVALKSRSIPAGEAVARSLAAVEALQAVGCERFFFKYCSTFDSTDEGNIGPVAAALADALAARRVLFVPSFPENGRTVDGGCLFVHGKPLNESGMQNHPLNPMTDANLVRVLGRQVGEPVGLVGRAEVQAGLETTRRAIANAEARLLIADAETDGHLKTLGLAVVDEPLVTGGSAVAQWLARAYQGRGLLPTTEGAADLLGVEGHAAVLAGSCSAATRGQIAHMKANHPALRLDPVALARGDQSPEQVVAWAGERLARGPVLIYSSATPEEVEAVHADLGIAEASRLMEAAAGDVAAGLVERGVGRLVVAGGETSGAVLNRLGVRSVRIGPEVEPGVPWVVTTGAPRLALALKSGNFGSEDFFTRAFEKLP